MSERQRVDIWLVRARFAKTRAAASRLVSEGGVRLVHNGQSRRLEKPSAEVEVGDVLVFPQRGGLRTVRVMKLPLRRGPAAEPGSCPAQTGYQRLRINHRDRVVHLPEKGEEFLLIPLGRHEPFPAFTALGQVIAGTSGSTRGKLAMQQALELFLVQMHQASS